MLCYNNSSSAAPVNFRKAIWFTLTSQFPLAWYKLYPVFLFTALIISVNTKLNWASHFLRLKNNILHTKCSSLGSLCHAQNDITVSSGEVRTLSDIMTHVNTRFLTENKPINSPHTVWQTLRGLSYIISK